MKLSLKQVIPEKFRKRGLNSRDFLLAKMPKNSICAEIGVLRGDFSMRILRIVNPKKLYLIDSWEFQKRDPNKIAPGCKTTSQADFDDHLLKVQERFDLEIKNAQVILEKGYSSQILEKFDDEYFDWVYVDGNHNYEFVKNDLELSLRKIKKNGYITGDDYGNRGEWWEENPTRAVNEFISSNFVKFIQIKNHQYILQKI